jgi:eukaryotic-like serine/threonine-protein kinase
VTFSSSFLPAIPARGDTTVPNASTPRLVVPESALRSSLARAGYRIQRVVGEGGMGRVYAATQLSMRREVAVKTLLHRFAADESLVARFVREARISARLRSPHVVHVIDGGRTDCGIPYFAMELLEGRTFTEIVERDGPLAVERAVATMTCVAEALVEAHSFGILHRDVKPSNVFETVSRRSGRPLVKLLDFGVAKHELEASAALTAVGSVIGSTSYMAPEQASDPGSVGPRADVFGVGATLHALVTGLPPFGRRKNPGVLERARAPLAWQPLEDVVARCVAWDPRERHPSMTALVAALRALPRAPLRATRDA